MMYSADRILQIEYELLLHSSDWIVGGYAAFCRLDLSWLCCILQNWHQLVRFYSTV